MELHMTSRLPRFPGFHSGPLRITFVAKFLALHPGMRSFLGYSQMGWGLPSGYVNSLLLNMAIEIVSFPINSMVIFHSFVNVYQRVP